MFKSNSMGMFSLVFLLPAITLAVGIGVGYLLFQTGTAEAASNLDASRDRVVRLEASIGDKDARYRELLAEVAGYKREIAGVTATNETLREELDRKGTDIESAEETGKDLQQQLNEAQGRIRALEAQIGAEADLTARLDQIREVISPLEQDRLLLVELRKDTPDVLEEAQDYWETIKELAIAADPTLGAKVDRVIRFLPTYFEWFDGEYSSNCEALQAFFDTGAVEFGRLSGDLQSDIFLLLINRIDAAAGELEG